MSVQAAGWHQLQRPRDRPASKEGEAYCPVPHWVQSAGVRTHTSCQSFCMRRSGRLTNASKPRVLYHSSHALHLTRPMSRQCQGRSLQQHMDRANDSLRTNCYLKHGIARTGLCASSEPHQQELSGASSYGISPPSASCQCYAGAMANHVCPVPRQVSQPAHQQHSSALTWQAPVADDVASRAAAVSADAGGSRREALASAIACATSSPLEAHAP